MALPGLSRLFGAWPARAGRLWRWLRVWWRSRHQPRLAAAMASVGQGRRQLLAGRLLEAEASLQEALRLCPDDLRAQRLLGWVASEQGDWPRAAALWRAVLATRLTDEELAQALHNLAVALWTLGEFDEAAALVTRLAATKAGRLLAPELRMTLAQKAQDDQGHVAARQAYHDSFPEAAGESLAWLRFAGGDDPPEAARFTADDLRRAKDARAAKLILAYLELRLPHGEFLELGRQAVARFSDPLLAPGRKAAASELAAAAALQAEHVQHLLQYLSNAAELEEAQRRAQALSERFPEDSRARLMLCHAAVAAGDVAAIEALGAASGNFDLALWLAAAQGDQAGAEAAWRRLRSSRHFIAADGRGLDLRLLTKAPRQGQRDRLLLFAAFRNEREFAPWFLDYYRGLGVDGFFIVDNLSTDGTGEYLARQKDVALFASRDHYARACSGMRWINELIRRYGQGNWCIHVDADEQLVVPQHETRGLRGLVDGMAARGEAALPAFMLDTCPESLAALEGFTAGDDPLAVSPLIDPDLFFYGKLGCCFFQVRGGVRDRLFAFRSALEKTPILHGDPQLFYLGAHDLSYAKLSSRNGVLLHHKLAREALDLTQPDAKAAASRLADRHTHCRIRHSHYRAAHLEASAISLRGPNTIAYQDSAQLQRLGLLGDFTPFTPAKAGPSTPPN